MGRKTLLLFLVLITSDGWASMVLRNAGSDIIGHRVGESLVGNGGTTSVVVRRRRALEDLDECDLVLKIKSSLFGFPWLYKVYGNTVRDRGIEEKRPFWYFLRSLLTTFNPEEQARFTALSGISIEGSLIPTSHEEEELLVDDADNLATLHYLVASEGDYKQSAKMKLGWYEIAHANPTITSTYKEGERVDGKVEYFATYTITFAQILKNLEIPGKDGLHFLVPEFFPDCFFFFSDKPTLRKKQLRKYECRIDP